MATGRTIRALVMTGGLLSCGLGPHSTWAEDGPTTQELLNQMKAMEQRIQSLEKQLEQRNAGAPPGTAVAPSAPPGAAATTPPGAAPTLAPVSTTTPQPMVQVAPSTAPAALLARPLIR